MMDTNFSKKITCFIQARMSSTRLPGKVLFEFDDGETMLSKVYCQVKSIRHFENVVVLTSSEKSDDPIEVFCSDRGIPCLRGSLNDVYSRFCSGLSLFPCDGFARVCADSPFVNKTLLNFAIKVFHEEDNCVYVSNTLERNFPKGLSVQISNTQEFLSSTYSLTEKFSSEHICNGFESRIYDLKRINIFTAQLFEEKSYAIDEKEDLKFLSSVPLIALEQDKFYYKRM